jgi:hypothetical protein
MRFPCFLPSGGDASAMAESGDISDLLAMLANLAHENSRQLSTVSASSRPAISFFSIQPEQLTASSRGASYPFGIPKNVASVEISWPIRAITE